MIYRALEAWLGIVMVLAGVLKLLQPHANRDSIIQLLQVRYRTSAALSRILSTSEIVVGAALFVGRSRAVTLPITCGLLLVFTAAILLKPSAFRGCGCFGLVDAGGSSPWVSAMRNIVLLAAGLVVAIGAARGALPTGISLDAAAAGALAFLCSLAVYAMTITLFRPIGHFREPKEFFGGDSDV